MHICSFLRHGIVFVLINPLIYLIMKKSILLILLCVVGILSASSQEQGKSQKKKKEKKFNSKTIPHSKNTSLSKRDLLKGFVTNPVKPRKSRAESKCLIKWIK